MAAGGWQQATVPWCSVNGWPGQCKGGLSEEETDAQAQAAPEERDEQVEETTR